MLKTFLFLIFIIFYSYKCIFKREKQVIPVSFKIKKMQLNFSVSLILYPQRSVKYNFIEKFIYIGNRSIVHSNATN